MPAASERLATMIPENSDPPPSRPDASSLPLALLEAMRPRQWIKNALLFAGLLFTFNMKHFEPALLALAAFVCFCALSSAVYLLNDVVDRDRDLAHPRKRRRPIASGRLSVLAAVVASAALIIIGLTGSFLVRPLFGALAGGFLILNLAYSFWLKHEVVIDVLCLAAGFIIRALAGAVAVSVAISPWLLVCTALLSLVMGFGKRRQELTTLDSAADHRRVLQDYSASFLDQLISSMTAATVVSYLFYTFQSETAHVHPWIPITIPFVVYGLFRYLYLVHEKSMGGAPEDLLFRDHPLLLAVVAWAIAAVVAMIL